MGLGDDAVNRLNAFFEKLELDESCGARILWS